MQAEHDSGWEDGFPSDIGSMSGQAGSSGQTGTGSFLKDHELKLITLANFTESGYGTYPYEVMVFTAWLYLNRQNSGKWDSTWDSVMGSQSAIRVLYDKTSYDYYIDIHDYGFIDGNVGWNSVMEKQPGELMSAYDATLGAYSDWLRYGSGSAQDLTNGSIHFSHQSSQYDKRNGKITKDYGSPENRHNYKIGQFILNANLGKGFSFAWMPRFYSEGKSIVIMGSNDPCIQSASCERGP